MPKHCKRGTTAPSLSSVHWGVYPDAWLRPNALAQTSPSLNLSSTTAKRSAVPILCNMVCCVRACVPSIFRQTLASPLYTASYTASYTVSHHAPGLGLYAGIGIMILYATLYYQLHCQCEAGDIYTLRVLRPYIDSEPGDAVITRNEDG